MSIGINLQFMINGSEVKRYHTVRTIQEETVGHHSHGVAMFCSFLTDPDAYLLMAALTHDLAEHQLGDIPSPAKKKYGIGEQVNQLEEQLLKDHGFSSEFLTDEQKRVLKLADIFQGMTFCLREMQLGNKRMREVFDRYRSYAEDMILVGKERDVFGAIMGIYTRTV